MQINCVYGFGSTGKLVQILHWGIREHRMESRVVYGRRDKSDDPGVYRVCGDFFGKVNRLISRFTGLMYGGCSFSTLRIEQILRKEKPDVVHLQCINGYFVNVYRLVDWLKRHQIPTVVTLHAEFMHTANCGHALDCEKWKTGCGACPRLRKETESLFLDRTAVSFRKMKAAFEGFGDRLKIVSVSPWLMERAMQSPILKDKAHFCIYNCVNTEVFQPKIAQERKQKLCPQSEKMVFHATAGFSDDPNDLKGGHWVLKLAEQMKGQAVRFVIAGSTNVKGEIPDNVTLLGRIADQTELAGLYSMADVTLVTSKRETFSMVTAESLCCGTPVAGFKAGAPEQIGIPEYSSFCEQGDLAGLEQGIHKMIGSFDRAEIAEKAKNLYAQQKMIEDYLEIYRSF